MTARSVLDAALSEESAGKGSAAIVDSELLGLEKAPMPACDMKLKKLSVAASIAAD
jgi:hypothetical protein